MPVKAIISNRVVTAAGVRPAIIVLKNGIIEDIVDTLPAGDYAITDLGNNVVMPGIIDPHVHINEPGRTEWEGFDTATKAALAGGITMLVDMPLNASPVTTTAAAFDQKIKAANNRLHTNCGFWGGIVPGKEKEIEPLIEKGVLGFKAFLTHSGIDEFPNVTEAGLHKVMPVLAKYDLPLLVHCELSDDAATMPAATKRYADHLSSRPREWEDNAIALMIRLCETYHCRTHIVHLSSANSITAIAAAKQKGLPLTVETAQHYLYFCAEEIPDAQTAFKCAPPIREKENNERLWQALKDGIIDFVATDHSPAPPTLKETASGDLAKAWGGIASLQWALPILWTAGKRHHCTIDNMVQWLCTAPARLIGDTTAAKGIHKGGRADFAVWNPEKFFTVTEENIHHRHKITPYLGEQLYGIVVQTWLNGEIVYDKGKFLHLNKGKIILK